MDGVCQGKHGPGWGGGKRGQTAPQKVISLDNSKGLGCRDPVARAVVISSAHGVEEHSLTQPRQGKPKVTPNPRGEAQAAPFALAKGDGKGPSIKETGLEEPHGDLRNGAVGGHLRPPPPPLADIIDSIIIPGKWRRLSGSLCFPLSTPKCFAF